MAGGRKGREGGREGGKEGGHAYPHASMHISTGGFRARASRGREGGREGWREETLLTDHTYIQQEAFRQGLKAAKVAAGDTLGVVVLQVGR
jgi:hypothetical protein